MTREPELEEGETCYYKDDTSIDPDIALSYIGDKVQSILGHLQKDFEGGVSAENLGAKFGGYGSFLPMYQRSPSIWSQQKSPQRVQNVHLPRSPDHVNAEGHAPNSVVVPAASSTQRVSSSSSSSMRSSQTLKTCFEDASIRQKATLSSNRVAEAFPGKVERPSSNLCNAPDQRTLKVRIKVGPDRGAKYNAEIYNLGLTSPSSSEENSHEESDGLLLESYETPNESPAKILQIMTSFPVAGGLLLSPLCEDLLNLASETKSSVESEHEAVSKSSLISVRRLNNDIFGGKKTKFVDKNGKLEKPEDEFVLDLNDCKQKTLGNDNQECTMQPFHKLDCKPLSNTAKESEKDVQVKKRKGSKDRVKGKVASGDLVKDTSIEHTSEQSCGKYMQPESRCSPVEKIEEHRGGISQKDVSFDHGQGSRSRGNGNRASFKACSDNSEGEMVKGATDDSSLKVGLNATSSEQNGFGTPHAVRLSFEGEKKSKGSESSRRLVSKADSSKVAGCAAPQNKYSGKKDVHRFHPSQKDVVRTTLEHKENPKHLVEGPSGEKRKNFKLDAAKAKSAYADKLKERFSDKKYTDKVTSDTHTVEPPAAAIHSKEGIFTGLEQTVAAPVLIQEDWVGCDRCQKWRLLPYGTKSEQLPDKWVCSMLDWLPGMNRCDISEDETTMAVHASYLVPVPEIQHKFQAHADAIMGGVISASAHNLDQNHQNCASDQMKKQKLKEKQNYTVTMSGPVPSNGKKQLQRLPMKNGSLKEVKQSLAGVNATNKLDMQHPNTSATVVAKLNKRKGKHMIGDDANPRKKIKKESAQLVRGKVKRIKSKDELTVDNFQSSGGNLGSIGHSLTPGLPNEASVKDGKKIIAQKDTIPGRADNFRMSVKEQRDQMQDLLDNEPLHVKECNGREPSKKKMNLKDYEDSEHQVETWKNNGSNVQDRKVSIKENSKDGDLHRDKKPRVSQIKEKQSKRSQRDDISKGKNAETRVQSSGSKEYPVDRDIEKERRVMKPKAKPGLTIDDINKLRKDLGCEQLLMATSSSSKVSDSRQNKISYMEAKGSPAESVSSSPFRIPYMNQVSPVMETLGKVDSIFNDVPAMGSVKKVQGMNGSLYFGMARMGTSGLTNDNGSEILDSKNKLKEGTDVEVNHCEPRHEVSSNIRHPFSDESSIKLVKVGKSVDKRDFGKLGDSRSENKSACREQDRNDVKSSYPCSTDVMQQNLNQDIPRSSVERISTPMEPWSGKLRIDLRKQGGMRPNKHAPGSFKKSSMGSRPLDASVAGDTSKALKDTASAYLRNGTDDFNNNEAEPSVPLDASLVKKKASGLTASTAFKKAEDVLKEAEELRIHADLIKNSGFSSESNYEYFKAALKFLHGGSLLEACNGENSKNLEMSPMQMYGAAAKLCQTCAHAYEKGHEMVAAALAYKCVEVAYLRVVYHKSSTTSRVWQDLRSSLQMVPQGESPSSSASDVDNLNNLAMAEKTALSKGSGSRAGNHVRLPHNRPNFVRLLDFTKDVNSAMEAAKKAQDIFAAAHLELEKSQNKEAIVSIKRVIDLSFQNVEEIVRLVWLAFNTINHQGLSGSRE